MTFEHHPVLPDILWRHAFDHGDHQDVLKLRPNGHRTSQKARVSPGQTGVTSPHGSNTYVILIPWLTRDSQMMLNRHALPAHSKLALWMVTISHVSLSSARASYAFQKSLLEVAVELMDHCGSILFNWLAQYRLCLLDHAAADKRLAVFRGDSLK
ncbi:hypothetical protein FRB93_003972 [Tulasnella sp. JGI-2019a]|nr:hypothetical protein FRB93_003972 [Tulasnella sp. JGI-2019a]